MKEADKPDTSFMEHVALRFGKVYFQYDIKGNSFRYISPACEQLLGRPAADLATYPLDKLSTIHQDDREYMRSEYEKLLHGQEKTKAEFRIVTPDQKVRWVCLSACVLHDERGSQLIGGFAEDITEMKEYMHNILKYNNKKNATLEILSHDLAAPFANIQAAIDAIKHHVGEQDAELLQLIEFIKADSMRGSDMIRDFVDNEFLESSQVVLHKERVDIAEKVRFMMDTYKEQSKLVEKEFRLISPEKAIYIFVDNMKFLQVMNNLVSNAIKFTEENGIITVAVEEKQDTVQISVSDNGIGIPEQMRPFLFDRFTKARRAGIRGEKSVGLGMSIIHTIVELHGGTITYESQEGIGTTFYIQIPSKSQLQDHTK